MPCHHLHEPYHVEHYIVNEVSRSLARYSPCATTTNQPTNRAPIEPARPGKNANFEPNLVIFGQKLQIFTFLIYFLLCPTKKTMRCQGGILICGYHNFCSLPTAVFAPKNASLGIYRPCRLNLCPVGWWFWHAGCISQDTFLLYLTA